MRLNVALVLAMLLAGLVLVASGDHTNWTRGYGYDGRLYGDLAQHFPGAVFGDEGVTPPGYGQYTEKRPVGLDAYYARRILPSALVYYSLATFGIEHNHSNVVACFGIWTALLAALVALLWCLTSDRLGLSRTAKLVGACGLLLNFATLKSTFYFPVTTDALGVALAAALLYFWVARNVAGLAFATFLSAFTWPTNVPLGLLLIVFGFRELPLERMPLSFSPERRRASLLKVGAALLPAVALLAYIVHLRARDYVAPEGIPLGGAFALSIFCAAAFLFGALYFLIPDLRRGQLREIATAIFSRRVLVAVVTLAAALIALALLSRRPGFYSEIDLLKSSLWFSALNPGLFLVALFGFFGPMLALTAVEWPRVSRQIQGLGVGAVLVAAYFIAACLLTESRKSIGFYPFIVLFFVLACSELIERRWFLPALVGTSLIASRVWLPIGHFGFGAATGLRDFPAARYFMSSGLWTSFDMYLLQLGAAALIIGAFLWLRRRTPPGGVAASASGPAP